MARTKKASQASSSEASRRVATSDDVEVSTYLEIARERSGQRPTTKPGPRPAAEAIVVIDFGSQYSRLIARRIREQHVYCELVPPETTWEQVEHLNPRGVVLSGGPASVYEEGAPLAPAWVYGRGLPALGICYGMQLMAHQLGGRVEPSDHREYGHAELHQNAESTPLFAGLPPSLPVWMSHGDRIAELPPGFRPLAYTENSPVAVMGNDQPLIDRVLKASDAAGERMWQLPLFKEYREQIRSSVADLKNTGGRDAGAITAAYFISEFAGDVPWVHLDIAGTARVGKDRGFQVTGSTGVGVRTLVNLVEDLAENPG